MVCSSVPRSRKILNPKSQTLNGMQFRAKIAGPSARNAPQHSSDTIAAATRVDLSQIQEGGGGGRKGQGQGQGQGGRGGGELEGSAHKRSQEPFTVVGGAVGVVGGDVSVEGGGEDGMALPRIEWGSEVDHNSTFTAAEVCLSSGLRMQGLRRCLCFYRVGLWLDLGSIAHGLASA